MSILISEDVIFFLSKSLLLFSKLKKEDSVILNVEKLKKIYENGSNFHIILIHILVYTCTCTTILVYREMRTLIDCINKIKY
jgi:hypothetical protein